MFRRSSLDGKSICVCFLSSWLWLNWYWYAGFNAIFWPQALDTPAALGDLNGVWLLLLDLHRDSNMGLRCSFYICFWSEVGVSNELIFSLDIVSTGCIRFVLPPIFKSINKDWLERGSDLYAVTISMNYVMLWIKGSYGYKGTIWLWRIITPARIYALKVLPYV